MNGSPHGTQIAAHTVVINPSESQIVASEMKPRIRQILTDIAPELLSHIDTGTSSLAFHINEVNLRRLERLAENAEFAKYMAIQQSSQYQWGGSGNRLNPGIYDKLDSGNMYYIVFMISEKLKEPAPASTLKCNNS